MGHAWARGEGRFCIVLVLLVRFLAAMSLRWLAAVVDRCILRFCALAHFTLFDSFSRRKQRFVRYGFRVGWYV